MTNFANILPLSLFIKDAFVVTADTYDLFAVGCESGSIFVNVKLPPQI